MYGFRVTRQHDRYTNRISKFTEFKTILSKFDIFIIQFLKLSGISHPLMHRVESPTPRARSGKENLLNLLL